MLDHVLEEVWMPLRREGGRKSREKGERNVFSKPRERKEMGK
jgi:hypothetical protein